MVLSRLVSSTVNKVSVLRLFNRVWLDQIPQLWPYMLHKHKEATKDVATSCTYTLEIPQVVLNTLGFKCITILHGQYDS